MVEPARARVLFVTQSCPWPKNSGGNIRTYYVLAHLARLADVTLVTIAPDDADGAHAHLEALCHRVEFVPAPRVRSRPLTLAGALVSGRPAFIQHNLSRSLAAAVTASLARDSFDWVHLNQIDTFHYLRRTRMPFVLDTHNLHWRYYARRAAAEKSRLLAHLYARDSRLLERYELAAFRRAHRVLVCSDIERSLLQSIDPSLPVSVVPNGVDCDEYRPMAADPFDNDPDMLFVGDMAYAPNDEGVREFAEEVLPLVQRHVPGARLTIVGRSPSPALEAIAERRNDVAVTGFVEDMMPYIARAKVFVVPIRYGAGTRLKVLQAFACGLPTVATSIGAEGIDCTDGSDIVIADDNADMARRIVDLMTNRAWYASIRARCRDKALALYDWNVIGEALRDDLRHLTAPEPCVDLT